jgi:hypothetical protein
MPLKTRGRDDEFRGSVMMGVDIEDLSRRIAA